MPWDDKSDNIDLFPEGFLWERGCKIERSDEHRLVTPKGRSFEIKTWGSLPYVSKNDLNLIIDDLPESAVPGRSGHSAGAPTAARACRTVSRKELRSQLKHFQGEYNKD